MKKPRIFTQEEKESIIRLYVSGEVSNKHKLGVIFKTSHNKITDVLVEGGIDLVNIFKANPRVSYTDYIIEYESKLLNGEYFIAVCKSTGKEYLDYTNTSGVLSKHIIELNPDVIIPTSFKRRNYVIDNNVFWHEGYFNIIKKQNEHTNIKENHDSEIVRLYSTKEIVSTHKLGEMFKLGHKRISEILKDNGVVINKRGRQITHGLTKILTQPKIVKLVSSEGNILVAKCKKTGLIIKDPMNLSGSLTNHLIKEYGYMEIPSNTYQRKKYEIEHGKQWFEEYFDIIEVKTKDVRKCRLCEWDTEDVENKTGCFEKHIINTHKIGLNDYLNQFPEDVKYHKSYVNKKELESTYNHIICNICGEKMKYLTSTHLSKHNITLTNYKLKFPTAVFLSESYRDKLKVTYETGLKLHEHTFSSKPQIEITEFIESFGFVVKRNNKKLLGGVEIDILIDDLKIGIEYNGLYYHTERMGKTKNYHLNKTKLMNNVGYKLIHIFEDEWLVNDSLIKNKISHLLGFNNTKTIGARKCDIIDVSNYDKNNFLNLYHIQGSDKSNIHIGATYNNELLGIMCFDNKRNMSLVNKDINENEYELTRFATNTNYKIPGIADKLLKEFIRKYNPSKIISFGDARWVLDSENNMYTKLGFKLVEIRKPDYRYYIPKITKNKRFHKFGFGLNSLKRKFPDLEFYHEDGKAKTEKELTTELGYDRIWDCGLFKYEMSF